MNKQTALRRYIEQAIEIAHSPRYDEKPGTVDHEFWMSTLSLADGSHSKETHYTMTTSPAGVLSLFVNGDAVSTQELRSINEDIQIREGRDLAYLGEGIT